MRKQKCHKVPEYLDIILTAVLVLCKLCLHSQTSLEVGSRVR